MTPWSMACKMGVMLPGVSCWTSPSELLAEQVHRQWAVTFWKESFFLSSTRCKIFNTSCCKQMCCHAGCFVPFIQHRQSRFSILLKSPRGFGDGKWGFVFNLQLLTVLAPNKRVSLSFEALKPGIDFSSLAMKVLDGIFFQWKTVSSTVKIYCSCICL